MGFSIFINKLKEIGWHIDTSVIDMSLCKIDNNAKKRIARAPDSFKEFINSFNCIESIDETMWFLSYKDYSLNKDAAFKWCEFEIESLQYTEDEDRNSICYFWERHIPFFLSVKGEYNYFAICTESGDNYGKIYHGSEPEYEEVSLFADNLSSFFNKFIQNQEIKK